MPPIVAGVMITTHSPGTAMNQIATRLLLTIGLVVCVAGLSRTAHGQLQGTTLCDPKSISCPDSSPPGIAILANGQQYSRIDSVPPNTRVVVTVAVCANEQLASTQPWSVVFDNTDITSHFFTQSPPPTFQWPCRQLGQNFYESDTVAILSGGLHTLTVTATTLQGASLSKVLQFYQPRWGVTVQAVNPSVNVAVSRSATATFSVTNVGANFAQYSTAAMCSGAAIVSSPVCTASPATLPLSSGAKGTVTVAYATTSTALATGALNLAVTQMPDSASASAVVTVHTVSLLTPPLNAGNARRYDRCFTAYAARNAEYRCGGLVYAYSLPTIRRLDRAITPRMIYSSKAANSRPLVATDVTVPARGDSVAYQVFGHLYLDGNPNHDYCNNTVWPRGGFPVGQTRRVVCALQGAPWGLHTYEFLVQATIVAPSQIQSDGTELGPADLITLYDVSGKQLMVENGFSGPFGAGWYFEGVETFLHAAGQPGLWTSFDGSMVAYTPNSNNTVWHPVSTDHSDSITLNSDGSTTRWAPHGVQVQIGTNGVQSATIDPLGYRTTFAYNGPNGNISQIQLPQLTGTATPITITVGAQTDSLSNPDPTVHMPTGTSGVSGAFPFHLVQQQLAYIASPDGDTVRFGYMNHVLTSVTDKNGYVTTFTYDSAYNLTSSTINMGSQPPIVRHFRAAESVGLGVPLPAMIPDSQYVSPDSATTVITGPDSGQVTTVWLDSLGQETGISDALGQITGIQHGDSHWGGLPTRVAYPNGQVLSATYDTHGNLQTETDANPYGTGVDATTTYAYDPKWDLVTSIRSPTGVVTSLAYDQTDGNRLWQQPGSDTTDHSHRTNFVWDQTSKLLARIYPPTVPFQQIFYDSLGNVKETVSGLGHKTWFNNDGLGRDTLTATQLDSLGQNYLTTRHAFDALGRETLTVTSGPALTGRGTLLNVFTTSPETLTVATFYNRESVIDSVRRSMSPDTNHIGRATTGYRYDPAYRVISEIDPLGAVDSYQYDPAGNRIKWTTRRHSLTVMSTYDLLNRLIQRITPQVSYVLEKSAEFPGETFPDTLYANSSGGYTIRADTATFNYDPVGHITSAVNGDAQVRRTYYLDGSVATDTLAIRTYTGNNFTTHVYGLGYTYDLDGRRTRLARPHSLTAPPPSDTTYYTYDPLIGKLATVTDFYRKSYTYTYDLASRPATLTSPGHVTDSWTYDGDSRLFTRLEKGTQLGGPAADSIMHSDRYTYDWRDKEISVEGLVDSTEFLFTALGNLYKSYTMDSLGFTDVESGGPDPLGNHGIRNYQSRRLGAMATDNYLYQYEAKSGRLMGASGNSVGNYTEAAWYDSAGNKGHATSSDSRSFLDEVVYYYAADNRLRALDHRRCNNLPGGGCTDPNNLQLAGTFDEYRYDALGRRILVRSNRTGLCTGVNCHSEIKAVIWDGHQDLFELRADGSQVSNLDFYDAQPSGTSAKFYGRVGYTIGATLDQPLAVEHPTGVIPTYFIPHANWHGLFDRGTDSTGRLIQCTPPACIDWPAIPNALDYSLLARQEANLDSWSGDLVNQSRDISGQMFMRNRYYDPTTGRFTQEDPLGLGGGLNAYGFASGDPVNYSDPFGLSTCFIWSNQNSPDCVADKANIASCQAGGPCRTLGGSPFGAISGPLGEETATAEAATATARVIGSFPEYVDAGKALGAKIFSVPKAIWDKMSAAEREAANVKFLARGVQEGAEFIVKAKNGLIRAGSDLEKEVGYLLEKGYSWAKDGSRLVPPQ
jgi:RHS repeat-associated protein